VTFQSQFALIGSSKIGSLSSLSRFLSTKILLWYNSHHTNLLRQSG